VQVETLHPAERGDSLKELEATRSAAKKKVHMEWGNIVLAAESIKGESCLLSKKKRPASGGGVEETCGKGEYETENYSASRWGGKK